MNGPFAAITLVLLLGAGAAAAAPGDEENGKRIYAQRCVMCHGHDGDGMGPGAERLNPPPRDFTAGMYKFKTTTFDDPVPNDDDLFRTIRDGMPGSAMPAWRDVLSERDIWDVLAYCKTFAGLETEKPSAQIDYGTRVATSRESIEAGRRLFHDGDRCAECHGVDGKGDAVKRLKDDLGARTWPRNLTKPWTFRASNRAEDVFRRITVGIPGTQMPSFADPRSPKKLSIEERWHVANYVASLANTERAVRPENTVIKAEKVAGDLPATLDDPAWGAAAPASFFMLPQMIAESRFFTPANDVITARALFNDREIALLIEWDDRTKSIPGDEAAEKIAEPEMGEDAVAVQFPVKPADGVEKPYFLWGDAQNPVSLWEWRSGTTKEPARLAVMTANGGADMASREAAAAGMWGRGEYKSGTWRVAMKRALVTAAPEQDIQLSEGRFIPIAFSAWDGSNGEAGRHHTLTTWYWLLLKPDAGWKPVIAAVIVALIVGGLLAGWARSARRRRAGGSA